MKFVSLYKKPKSLNLNVMKRLESKLFIILLAYFAPILNTSCTKDDNSTIEPPTIIAVTGDINASLDQFRHLLGDQLNTTPGHVAGRREANWDGVPEQLLSKKLPVDFLNPVGAQAVVANQRGLVYSAGGNFQVSKNNFAEINPTATNQFSSFSGDKSFANTSSSLWDVEFQVAGKTEAAFVRGFGIVFSDVDLPHSTSMEFFSDQRSLGKFFVPEKNGSNFSFLGVYFKNEKVTRIVVTHDGHLDQGQKDISDNGPADLVTMDNFLWNEPVKK